MPPFRAIIVEYDIVWADPHDSSPEWCDGTLTITSNPRSRAASIPCVAILAWDWWRATFETEWNPDKEQLGRFEFQTMNEAMIERVTDIPESTR